jgi:O-antigen/teichoic acid export membrane protein
MNTSTVENTHRENNPKKGALGNPAARLQSTRSQLVGGSLILLAGSSLVGLTNFIYNVATARLLGPAGFAHATTVYTMLMLMSAITLSYQVVCAKYVARLSQPNERTAIYGTLHHRSWIAGFGIALLLVIFQRPITDYLNLPHEHLIELLALGTAFYIPLGVRRGYIQGVHAFSALAVNFMVEGVVRVAGVFLLIGIGWGVEGAVLASVLAVVLAYFTALPTPGMTKFRLRPIANSFREGLQAIVYFAGQTVINNFDIVLVKHFFSADLAGLYAAAALVGRLVNMCAWSVVNTMFPVSARKTSERESRSVLVISLIMVCCILAVLIGGLYLLPSFVWKTIFGVHFEQWSINTVSTLLILRAVTAGVFAISSVIITHEMSRKVGNTSWVQLAFSGLFIAGICAFHETLRQVILIQLVLMLALLAVLIIPFFVEDIEQAKASRDYRRVRLLRRLAEEEVIAEFLRSEFHHAEFDDYRVAFDSIVQHPDLGNRRENEVRRALLFLRRGAMWRELPPDTTWYAVGLALKDLSRIRFFPRAQWRRVARGSFYLPQVVEQLQWELQAPGEDEFLNKLRMLSFSVREGSANPTVLLIGVNSTGPLTILDGNHRMAAAMLGHPPAALGQFRFICGFSPKMTRCCWYDTNFNTVLRYLKNIVRHFPDDPETHLDRYQQEDSIARLAAQQASVANDGNVPFP